MASSRRRSVVRADARRLAKDLRDRARLVALEPGGAADRPIAVSSASLVEPKAIAPPCAMCGANIRLSGHAAKTIGGVPLRLARVLCPMCGHERTIYFCIAPPLPN